ncbi:MAG: hypothetical protein HZB46_00070 [Solirubrobacterales bacterium]|nr:hypothetical protein [Solirubrobacterales bacterium]
MRDIQDARERQHPLALELLERARAGEVELAFAPQGKRLDVDGNLEHQLDQVIAEHGLTELPQLAYLSDVTYLSDAFYLGACVEGFREAWDAVAKSWGTHDGKAPPGHADSMHVTRS